jgi:hypothetical protein
MKVENMTSSRGNKVANQFIITGENDCGTFQVFQSYKTTIAKIQSGTVGDGAGVFLDRDKWNYSVTTGRYRNQFLGETKKETQKKIDSGEYILADLN